MRWFRRHDMDMDESPMAEIRIEMIRELVDGLPTEQRLALSLFYFGAGSPTEAQVAEEMGLTEYKFKRLISDAIEALRETLQEKDRLGTLLSDHDPRVRAVLRSLTLGADERQT